MSTTHTRPKKTLIICVWIGSWPTYFPYFTKTASQNTSINWLIISDQSTAPILPENIEFQHYSIHDLNSLASDFLEIPVTITDSRKLCDFKPVYGLLFNSFLRGYDYWGYCDLDLILGDLDLAIQPQIEKGMDIISFYKDYISGPLCLFKNSERTINLFRQIMNYREILADPEHYALDENNKKRMPEIAAYANFRSRLSYLTPRILKLCIFNQSLKETRYSYQWYLKKQVCTLHPPYDMTDVVWTESEKGKLTVSFQDDIRSDRSFIRAGKRRWKISWKNGKLSDSERKKEFPVFHFIDLKNKLEKSDVTPEKITDNFSIDPQGFHI